VLAAIALVLLVAAAAYLMLLRPPAPRQRQQHRQQQHLSASDPRGAAHSGVRLEPDVRSTFANALGAALDSSTVHSTPLGDGELGENAFTHTFAAPPKVVPFVGRHVAFDFADCDARVLADATQLEAILARALHAVVRSLPHFVQLAALRTVTRAPDSFIASQV
jgi:hypothetical protein